MITVTVTRSCDLCHRGVKPQSRWYLMTFKRMMQLLILLSSLLFLATSLVTAKVNIKELTANTIDLDALVIDKASFYEFLREVVHHRTEGLGMYGQFEVNLCEIPLNDRPMMSYRNVEDREIRFISNPSCPQLVLIKVLREGYGYDPSTMSSYENRKCIRSVEKIISPLLEYYTITWELENKKDCIGCDAKKRLKLQKIVSQQKRIKSDCTIDQIGQFLDDLEAAIEEAYRTKPAPQ